MTFAPENIHPGTWPALHALLAPAIKHGNDSTVAELIDELLAHTAQLWVKRTKGGDPIAVAVSELVPTPSGPLVHGRLLAGRGMALWVDELIACISDHGRYVGAIGISIEGRRGWEKVLGARGWKRRAVVMETRFEATENSA